MYERIVVGTDGRSEQRWRSTTPPRSPGTSARNSALCALAHEVDAAVIVVGNRGMAGAKRFLGSISNDS